MFEKLFGRRDRNEKPRAGEPLAAAPTSGSGDDVPKNELEATLFRAMRNELSMDDFLEALIKSKLNIPSSTEAEQDGRGLNPVLFDRRGVTMAAAFTDLSRIGEEQTRLAPYVLQTEAQWLIRGMSPDFGLVIFAGPGKGCELMPDALAQLRKRL